MMINMLNDIEFLNINILKHLTIRRGGSRFKVLYLILYRFRGLFKRIVCDVMWRDVLV
jgi:hypothetical protein